MSAMETSGCTCVYFFESLFSIHLFCFLRTDFVLTMETHFLSLWFPIVIIVCCTEHGFCSWNLHNIQIKDLFPFLKPISKRFSKEISITVQFFTVLGLTIAWFYSIVFGTEEWKNQTVKYMKDYGWVLKSE